MNPSNPQTPEAQRIQARNQKALDYLHALRDEDERADRAKCRLLGCLTILVFNALFWTAFYLFLKNLGEL
jgi:hypothetical protein